MRHSIYRPISGYEPPAVDKIAKVELSALNSDNNSFIYVATSEDIEKVEWDGSSIDPNAEGNVQTFTIPDYCKYLRFFVDGTERKGLFGLWRNKDSTAFLPFLLIDMPSQLSWLGSQSDLAESISINGIHLPFVSWGLDDVGFDIREPSLSFQACWFVEWESSHATAIKKLTDTYDAYIDGIPFVDIRISMKGTHTIKVDSTWDEVGIRNIEYVDSFPTVANSQKHKFYYNQGAGELRALEHTDAVDSSITYATWTNIVYAGYGNTRPAPNVYNGRVFFDSDDVNILSAGGLNVASNRIVGVLYESLFGVDNTANLEDLRALAGNDTTIEFLNRRDDGHAWYAEPTEVCGGIFPSEASVRDALDKLGYDSTKKVVFAYNGALRLVSAFSHSDPDKYRFISFRSSPSPPMGAAGATGPQTVASGETIWSAGASLSDRVTSGQFQLNSGKKFSDYSFIVAYTDNNSTTLELHPSQIEVEVWKYLDSGNGWILSWAGSSNWKALVYESDNSFSIKGSGMGLRLLRGVW